MNGARGPAGVGVWREGFASVAGRVVADDQITRNQVDLLPIVVDKGRSGVNTGSKARMARAKAALVLLIQKACKYLLLNSFWIPRRCMPAGAQVDGMKLLVFFLDRQCRLLHL